MQFAHPGWLWLLVLIPCLWLLERARPRILWPSFAGFPPGQRCARGGCCCGGCPHAARAGDRRPGRGAGAAADRRRRDPDRRAGRGDRRGARPELEHEGGRLPRGPRHRRISRLEAAKATFARFVEGRPDDLIGLVVFANYPDLTCPPTLDHRFLVENAAAIRPARPGDDGTNIGDAIAVALEALRKTTPSKKVLVLLTDGNNEPAVPHPLDPEQAATLARDLGVTCTRSPSGRPGGIVRGTDPDTKLPVMAEVEGPNLALLERLATITGGRSFVATDADALDEVFQTISTLEKSPIKGEIRTRYDEHFAPWAGLALALLLIDRLLVAGPLRRLP